MKKLIALFGSYTCINSFAQKNLYKIDDSDKSVVLNQKEFEEDQNVTISSFETKLQLKTEAFYEELLNDQPIATQLQILITDLIFYKDLLEKTNNHYDYLLIYEQIINFLKNSLFFSESKLRNLSINDAPSLSSTEKKATITKDELIRIYNKTLKNKTNLKNIINKDIKSNKYQEILNSNTTYRLSLIKEIAENKEFQIEQENAKKLKELRIKEQNETLEKNEIEDYKILKNLESNKERRKAQNTSQTALLLNNSKTRLIKKMQNPELQEPLLEENKEILFFITPNKIITFKQGIENLDRLLKQNG